MAPVQFLINTVSALGTFVYNKVALFVIYWSKTGNMRELVNLTFEHRKLNNLENQADHLSNIAYFYAIFIICLSSVVMILRFIQGSFNQALKSDTDFVLCLNKIISDSTEHFFIFMSVYLYLLQKKGCNCFLIKIVGLKNQHILLMPFWFLIGRVGSLAEVLTTHFLKNKFKFWYFGAVLTFASYFVMIGNIFGHNPLTWF